MNFKKLSNKNVIDYWHIGIRRTFIFKWIILRFKTVVWKDSSNSKPNEKLNRKMLKNYVKKNRCSREKKLLLVLKERRIFLNGLSIVLSWNRNISNYFIRRNDLDGSRTILEAEVMIGTERPGGPVREISKNFISRYLKFPVVVERDALGAFHKNRVPNPAGPRGFFRIFCRPRY